mmetsp:Transcript_6982/g.11591  ORF Transcript_6982/g.11591 Transcript_6982/m.11591 type:complete len:399 (-) Transcript_6982:117-1313(-)
MKESLAAEHDSKHVRHTLPCFLDGGGVTNKDRGHLETDWRNVTDGRLEVVWDPLDKVRGILADHLEHLVVNFLAGHLSAEHHRASEVASVTRVGGTHHVLGIESLLSELRNSKNTVVLRLSGGERSETNEEEMETWEWNHVDSQFSEIAVELSRETERAGGSSDGIRNEVVQVTVTWVSQLESTEADIVKGFVIKSKALVSVLNQLVDGESSVVRLNNSVRDLWGGNDTISAHDTIRVLLADLRNEKGSHTRTSSSSHGVRDLETLKHITRFGLLSDNIHDGINELSSLSVVTLGPVISSSRLSENKVIRAEELSERSRTDGIHGTRLKIGQNSTWNVTTSLSFVEIDVDALELKRIVSFVSSGGTDTVLGRHDLPELGTNLVTTLTGLKMNDFSHGE